MMRQPIALLVVLMMVFGPFAQGVDVGKEIIIGPAEPVEFERLDASIEADAREFLSNIDGFFTENLGQKGEGAGRFYCEGSPLSASFGASWFAYNLIDRKASIGQLIRVDLVDAEPVEPIAIGPSSHPSNYFIGKDPSGWVTDVGNYRTIVYPCIYPGIDLYFSIDSDRLKYEYIVHPGADPSMIQMRYSGADIIAVDEESGDLLIRTGVGMLRDEAPRSWQMTDGDPIDVPTCLEVVDGHTVLFDIGSYDPGLPLTIDPALLYSTYIGGTDDEGWTHGRVIMNAVLDDDSNIVIASSSRSSDFPTTPGAYIPVRNHEGCVVFKLMNDGSKLLFSTWLGGNSIEGCLDVDIGDNGDIFVCGWTFSTDFPTHDGALFEDHVLDGEAFVTHFDPNCSKLLHSTYIIGSSPTVNNIHVSGNDTLLITGTCSRLNLSVEQGAYDTTPNGRQGLFMARIDTNLSKVIEWTYLGGSEIERYPSHSVLDGNGNVYISARTNSTDLPTTSNAFQKASEGGEYDLVVAVVSADLSNLRFCTYLGGSAYEKVQKVRLDPDGDLLVTGNTNSTDFPTSVDGYDRTHNGGNDGFISKIDTITGTLVYSTFFGDDADDVCISILHETGERYLVSIVTETTSFPSRFSQHNGSSDVYFFFLDIGNNTISGGEYIGGSHNDYCLESFINGSTVTILGCTYSNDFPTTAGAFDRTFGGDSDIFALRALLDFSNGTPPSEPLNLSVTPGDDQVTLNWEPPIDKGTYDIVGYRLLRGTSADSLTLYIELGPNVVSHVDRSVTNGQTYYYSLQAFNWFGPSSRTGVVNATPIGVPSIVLDLEAIPGCSTVQLRWEPPGNDGGTPVLGYHVHRGLTILSIGPLATLEKVTEYLDEGLVNGQVYFYKVFAFNAIGTGAAPYDPVDAMPAGIPSEPLGLTLTPGVSQITLDWDPPREKGAEQLLGYIIHRGRTETSLERFVNVDHLVREYVDDTVSNGIRYFYSVQATNRIGEGPLCPPVEGIPASKPGVPRDLSCMGGDRSVTLTWSTPAFDGGAPVTGYLVFRGTTADQLEYLDTTEVDPPSFTDVALMNGQTFYYAVCAVNSVGNGPMTPVVEATPLALPDAPGDLVAEAGIGWVTITWLRPQRNGGAEVTRYNIHRGMSEDSLDYLDTVAKFRFTYEDSDVVAGTTYHYAVAAVTAAGEGPASEIASGIPYGPPGAPLDLSATTGDGEVTLRWEPVEDDRASPVSGYVIMRGVLAGAMSEVANLGEVTSYIDTTAVNGQTYYYAVAAINGAGQGDLTEPLSVILPKPANVPGMVQTMAADVKGAKVTLQWIKPQDDGGSPVTGYVILRGPSKENLEQIAEVGSAVTTWSEDGLKRGTTYYYSVAAKNVVGEGEPILPREVKVPQPAEESPGFEVIAVLATLLIVVPIVRRRVV